MAGGQVQQQLQAARTHFDRAGEGEVVGGEELREVHPAAELDGADLLVGAANLWMMEERANRSAGLLISYASRGAPKPADDIGLG